ncbi:hypothetical protein [Planktotalea frisia]|nr:hypothetical protein [Planktotalea frisia]MDB9707045.1 hypothetical protein [Planktotalea frisia]
MLGFAAVAFVGAALAGAEVAPVAEGLLASEFAVVPAPARVQRAQD